MNTNTLIVRALVLVIITTTTSLSRGDSLVGAKHTNAKHSGYVFNDVCLDQAPDAGTGRIVCADIAALDQTLVYNRFGSFNPFGMMFALRRDLSPLFSDKPVRRLSAEDCSERTGTEAGHSNQLLEAGKVRLKDCERPRPMTLRVNVGDTLLVRVNNLLHTSKRDKPPAPDFSRDFCEQEGVQDIYRSTLRDAISEGSIDQLDHGEVSCLERLPDNGADEQHAVVADEHKVATEYT